MTMNVAPERSTLSLPNARLRADGGEARVGPDGPTRPGQGADRKAPITVSRETPAGLSALRSVLAGLDQASSVGDVALATTDAISDLLGRVRAEAVAARSPGAQRGHAFAALIEEISDQARAASFGGVNLLDGSIASGALQLPADTDGSGELSLTARDLRPGGPFVTVKGDQDPAMALADVDASIANVEAAGQGLRSEVKRVEAHRAFVGVLSDAVSGEASGDLGVEGARLMALQVRQALSGQTLSVSNAAPQAVLSLFR